MNLKQLTELAEFLDTWGSNCGAPRSVFEGHLNILLVAIWNAACEAQRETIAKNLEVNDFRKAARLVRDWPLVESEKE